MEGAGIAQACFLNSIPFVIIRAISDKADGSAIMDYPEFEKKAAHDCAALVLEMIRSDASTQDIPVMFLTGNNSKESIVKVLSLKPADYLLKTIDKERLHAKIDEFFLLKASRP